MTIAKTTRRFRNSGDGVSTDFFFQARFFADSDIDVIVLDNDGIETTQTLDTDYTVSNSGSEVGGTVTFTTAPLATDTVTMIGSTPRTQPTDYSDNDKFPAETHEAALDRLTIISQQNGELADRALVLPPSSTSNPLLPTDDNRKGKLLGFDAVGNPVMHALDTDLGTMISVKQFTGDGTTMAFTLAVSPISKIYTIVIVNGITQDQSNYTLSLNVLTFDTAPPSGASIHTTVFVATSLTGLTAENVLTGDGDTAQDKFDAAAYENTDVTFADITGSDASFAAISGTGDLNINSGVMFVNASSGRMGVGTVTPGSTLEVMGNARFTSDSASVNTNVFIISNAAKNSGLYFGDPADTSMGWLVYDNATDELMIAANDAVHMRINSGGNVGVGTANQAAKLHVNSLVQADTIIRGDGSNASFTGTVFTANMTRAASPNADLFLGYSGGMSDLEFKLSGDGNGTCDGSWTGGGADYAEFFEWLDGNPNAEDRRGISVVLDGDKIREALEGEDPIGVVSGNPSVVGDAAAFRWKGKYLRDDYGSAVMEDYEVIDENGGTGIQQRRKMNPDYDPDHAYIPREERVEWDTVGLMGKLRLRNGQTTSTRWLEMRTISATVTEWLVK